MTQLQPFYEQVQAHYDLSDEFFGLFLDPSWTYSCAYFEPSTNSLHESQLAKIDLALGKCGLKPGMTLLDIGCGWGATALRAAEQFGVNVIGLTLSRNQCQRARQRAAEWSRQRKGNDRSNDGAAASPAHGWTAAAQSSVPAGEGLPTPSIDIRLQGWEEFDQPVDRIVSIGAFEHFRKSRYGAFFEKCRRLLPRETGKMLLHTIVMTEPSVLRERGLAVEHEHVLFAKFIGEVIFPGGQLCFPSLVVDHAQRAGFTVERVHALGPHYARTLDCWAANLQAKRDQAIALTSPQVYDDYLKYFAGCAKYFRSGHIDVMQFTLGAIHGDPGGPPLNGRRICVGFADC